MIPSKFSNWVVRYLRANPGSAFIIVFEILLAGMAIELWRGDSSMADELGVVAFILACVGVAIQTVISVRAGSEKLP